jgi:hypothetical protein
MTAAALSGAKESFFLGCTSVVGIEGNSAGVIAGDLASGDLVPGDFAPDAFRNGDVETKDAFDRASSSAAFFLARSRASSRAFSSSCFRLLARSAACFMNFSRSSLSTTGAGAAGTPVVSDGPDCNVLAFCKGDRAVSETLLKSTFGFSGE